MSIPFTYVYLIWDPYTDLYKIGKSDKPEERLKQLCNPGSTIPAAPQDYILLEAWLCPERAEAEMHEHLKDVRVRGEWFNLEDKWPDAAGSNNDIINEVSKMLGRWERYVADGNHQQEHLEKIVDRQTAEIAKLEIYQRQIEHAMLLGYVAPPRLLMPAPARSVEMPVVELVEVIRPAQNGEAIDCAYEDDGDIPF
jgi:hypothetical protein